MEKVPRKKGKKPLTTKSALLILLGCIVLAGAGAYFLRAPAALPPVSGEKERIMLLSRSTEEIASIAIAPRDGTPYPLIRRGDAFVLLGREDVPLRSILLDDLLLSLGALPAEKTLYRDLAKETGLTAADFGLSPAWTRVTVTYADGEKKELLVGDRTPDEETPQRYCMLWGDPSLYTILASDADPFLYEMEHWPQFDQPRLDGSLLDRIEITGDITWSLFYTPSGWQMEAPFSYPLASARMDALLDKIETMGFESCLGEADKTDLAAYGLDHPALTVRLTQAATVIIGETADGEQVSLPMPEKTYTLLLGSETGKSGVYLVWEGKVYKASNFTMGFWKKLSVSDYLLKSPVNFLVNNLSFLTFTAQEKTHRYEVRMVESITENNQIAEDEYGRVLYDCAVRRTGEENDMDASAFLSWYTRLASLSADGSLPADFCLTGESRGTIILENDHLTRRIDFYPYDTLHDALAVDGKALYYVRKTWLDGVADAP